MNGFKGKKIFITGGSRGIGKACCLEFAERGADVAFTYNTNKKEAEVLNLEINNLGVDTLMLQLNVRDFNKCEEAKERLLEKFGKIDVLINNAGIIKDSSLLMMQPQDWLDVIDTNLNGVFNMSKAFITTFMKQKNGCILNMTSLSGVIGLARQTNYSASKGGLIAFTKALAKEVAGFNIRVNAIAPGFIETDMLQNLTESYIAQAKAKIPLARFGEPQEVAKVAAFLASEEASYITGQVIRIDGGLGM